MSHSTDRAFSRLLAEHDSRPHEACMPIPPLPSISSADPSLPLANSATDGTHGPSTITAPASAPLASSDVEIRRILRQWERKEYFDILKMPPPSVDELGRPSWPCTANDVSRAFRKISVLVHPDKNPGEDARKAFEALNEAHRTLRDEDLLSDVLRKAVVKLKADKERDEAKSTGDERIQMNSLKLQKMAELRKEEGKSFSDTVLVQMKKRQEEAKRKVELLSRSRVKEYEEEEEKANLGALNPLISELKREMKGQGIGGRSTVRTDHDRREESKGNARGRGREDEEDDEEDDDVSHRIIKKKSKPAFM